MPTYYEQRHSADKQSYLYNVAVNKVNTSRKVPAGYVLLYQNSNYSNTTRQCAYLCEKDKVQWNGKVGNHNNAS